MTDEEAEEMYKRSEKGFIGCVAQVIEHGQQKCTDSNMRRSVCESTCDEGYTLLGIDK